MRNLGLIVALWLAALLPLNSLALGLGEIEVNSFLNQPLNAEIEVISARPGEVDDLLVSLASRDAFNRAGLERPQHLTDLRFKVNKSEDGNRAVIVVSSRGSIKEPFLNFLIEADWSKGRLLREFTILLDPPFYADQSAALEPASETAPSSEETVASEVEQPEVIATTTVSDEPATSSENVTEPIALTANSSQSASPPASSEYVSDESKNIIEGDVLVVKGDTLWSIASRYKDDDHSMSQVMLAFQQANPDAFNDGNINNLKLGSVLRAPSIDELDAMDEQAAYAEVLLQNGLWDEYVARVSGGFIDSGASDTSATAGESGEQTGGELSLLLPGEGESESSGTGDSADIEQLRTKLALAEEELEATRIENKDLESRVAELQSRLSKVEELQKMVEIEDDSLAQLQADQASDSAQDEGQDSVETTTGEDAISETIQADEEALLEELLAEEAAAQADEEAAKQQDDLVAEVDDSNAADDSIAVDDGMLSDEIVDETAPVEQAESDQMTDDETQATSVTTPPAPVIVTEPAARPGSIFDGILPQTIIDMIAPIAGLFANPIVLAAIGGVIVLLLVLVVVKRRKAAQDGGAASADDDLFASDDEEEFTPIHMTETEVHSETDIELPSETDIELPSEDLAPTQTAVEEVEDDFASTSIVQAEDMPEAEAAAPAAAGEQDDVLNEVDVYLAYGLYDNAEDLLVTSLGEAPDRADYRSKLLDTYFATKNADAFVGEAQKLREMGDAATPYWDRVQVMGYELAPDNGLFSDAKDSGLSAADIEIAKPQEADFDLGSEDEDPTNFSSTDFNLGEDDADADIPLEPADEAGELASTQQYTAGDELPSFDANATNDDIGGDLLELPDDIGDELEFSMDDEETGDGTQLDDDLDLPDDLDLDSEAGAEETELETELELLGDADEDVLDLDADDDVIDLDIDDDDLDLGDGDALELSPPDEDDAAYAPTSIITPNYEETAVIQGGVGDGEGAEDPSDIDLGMHDTDVVPSVDVPDDAGDIADEEDSSDIDLGMEITDTSTYDLDDAAADELALDDSDPEDISIIDFGGDDFVEPTAVMPTVADSDDDVFSIEDDDAETTRTGTFAPGDFDAPTEAVASIADVDDIDDLMLPDDVDEVSTKLDLARAFIDMGDTEGARGSLEEVMSEGNADQKAEAKTLLDQI